MTDWQRVADALMERDPERKCEQVARLPAPERAPAGIAPPPPGRPERPVRVHPRGVPRRSLGTAEGRIALIHAVAHIEFNAINLALDAALRFASMPMDYYRDWIRVARDEARHFGLLSARLRDLGAVYGDLPAHDGLWEMAQKTAGDPLERMALVPRVLEARGLDVTPGMIVKLRQHGDDVSASLLAVILEEEEAHVAIGSRWYHDLCDRRGLDREQTFRQLLGRHGVRIQAGALNRAARQRAGFAAEELDRLGEEWNP